MRYELKHEGATYIAIHFGKFDLADGDKVIISDANGDQSYELEGLGKMNLGEFWAQHIKGDTAVIEFVTAGDKAKGFKIDEYAAGFAALDVPPMTEEICGANDLENAICRSPSIEYDRGRAVARLLIQGTSLCTGWLASANNHLITNEHCISTSTAAANTDYEFGSEAPSCGSSNCQLCYPGTVFSGATFIQDSPGLDYCLVQITNGNPAATFGFLEIDNRDAIVGEQIYLVSHPGGRAKEFAYDSTGDVGDVGRVLSLNEPTCSGGSLEIGYNNDTQGGSSGSPVIAVSSQKVIALHHCRGEALFCGDPNRGVPIDLICAQICSIIGGGGTGCTSNADCSGGQICCSNSCVTPTCTSSANCSDGNSCTSDVCNNAGTCTASCSNPPVACGPSDGCCPAGCSYPTDPNCCRPVGTSCTQNNQCCSNKCRGQAGNKTCR